MKTRDVQRGIVSPNNREDGNSLKLGRVVRMRHSDRTSPTQRFRRGAGHDHPSRRKVIPMWSAVLSVVTLIIMGLAVSFWLLPYLSRKQPEESSGPLISYTSQAMVVSKFPSPSREQTLDLVKLAIANRDPNQLESLFRMGSANRTEVLDFLKTSDQRDGLVDHYEWLSSMDVDGLLMEGVLVVYKGKDKPVERLAILTPDEAGTWKLDFEAFARTVKPSWNDLLEKGADQAVVRVFVGKDVYFNGPFSDDKQWVCYGIASPDTDVVLRGYCKVGSTLAASMDRLFSDGKNLSRATVEIRRVTEGEARQFEIVRLMATDWVVPGMSNGES